MIEGITKSGFHFRLDQEVLDDYELLEELCEIDNGNNAMIVNAANRILGKEQMQKLKDHLRNENGRVPATKMGEEIAEILASCKETKNS